MGLFRGWSCFLGGVTGMLTDAQRTVLEPLVDAVPPHAKLSPRHLRRTVGAILWLYDNGAKWRSLLAEHGPW